MYKNVDETPLTATGMSTNYTWWLPLDMAIAEGKLETVLELVSKNKGVPTVRLTSKGEIPLHVATQHRQVQIVEKMIEIMPVEELKNQEKYGRSALYIAASEGNIEIVKALVQKRKDLVMVKSPYYDNNIPITVAARAGNKDVVHYLYPITLEQDQVKEAVDAEKRDKTRAGLLVQEVVDAFLIQEETDARERDKARAGLLISLIFGGFFDRALHLLQTFRNLVSLEDKNKVTALAALSMMLSAFESSFVAAKIGGFWLILKSHLDVAIYKFINDEDINYWLHTRRDVENSSNASSDNAQGGDGITNRKISWLHAPFRRALELVPGYKAIYDTKLKHQSALKLLKEIWKLISEVDDLGSEVDEDRGTTVEEEAVKAMFRATELGIIEFIEEIILNCPQLLSQTYPLEKETKKQDNAGQTIINIFHFSQLISQTYLRFEAEKEKQDKTGLTVFHYAIRHRQKEIFHLIEKVGPLKNEITMLADRSLNFMSHLAAKMAPTHCLNKIPGPALQMQHERQWLKDVESIMPPSCQEFENKQGKTARVLFTEEHADLLKEGATWMKDTATQCMVVATLITTIMFAAVFTVPGAKESDTGEPHYVHGKFPIVFLAANILSLCSSVASMLMFLAIITSRYSEEDFLQKLPQKLIRGLLFLFLSIVGMMIEFSVTVLFLVRYDVLWISFPIVFPASVPITIYALVEFPLFRELTFATIGKEEFDKGKRSGLQKNLKRLFLRGATS